jgi:hypothetical protein
MERIVVGTDIFILSCNARWTREAFEADFGLPWPAWPEIPGREGRPPFVARVYEPGVQHAVYDGETKWYLGETWPEGDEILARLKGALERRAERERQEARAERLARPIEEARQVALATVDAAAEDARRRYISPGTGQAMVYLQKLQEAQAYLKGLSEATPHLDLEAKAVGIEKADLASAIIQKAGEWMEKSSRIEAVRIKRKADIRAARTTEEIDDLWQLAASELEAL